jgi:hypothetical protein
LAAVFALVGVSAAQFTPGNLVVLRVGDGTAALTNASTASFLDQYNTATANQASPSFTSSLPTAGGTVLTISGTSTSDGQITRSATGQIIVAGYATAPGTTGVTGTLSSAVNRVVNAVDASGTATRIGTTSTNFSGNNFRSAWSDGTNSWGVGAGTGTVVFPGDTVVSSTVLNQRVIQSFNGNLYTSTGSGTPGPIGIFQVGTGLPTGSTTSTSVINTSTTGTGTASPYGFAFNAAGNVAYIADDRTAANGGGIQKWTFNGTNWTLAGIFNSLSGTNGARGLAVDFGGANPVLYATTNDNRLVTLIDTGSNFSDAAIVLATAGTNQAFRGVTFSPVPEPATVGLIGAAVLGCGAFVRRMLRGMPVA